ncbi:patatin-like phospholipase family protein [Acinetobacter sp. DSM 11652]|uniref:patatin-like phospholipase family protein n=1 Tax=Acinetobacter sp. DSM 11652 TaxID=346222 RepID=UPI0008CB412D|nr:patatin-like phospholipase family protein [Acinetobacter sp. DSM 11652]SEL83928.1 NTE family protein [Acinetobacter sp. DSM 11652]
MKKFVLLISLLPLIGLQACQQVVAKAQLSKSVSTPLVDASSHIIKNKHKKTDAPSVALVLGSGGARGYAHIGVIEVLEQRGIKPDFIVGSSAGSIVGSIYASGKSAKSLREVALNMQVNDVRDFNIGIQGFFDGAKVENYVNKQVDFMPLEQLPIPMYVVATELKNGNLTVFNYGNTGQAVRASISIPSMFIPVKIADKDYVDGGLVSPVPVNVARELGADIVIAVDILAQPEHTETSNVWGMFNQNINIMQNKIAYNELKNADIVIQPDLREKAHIFDVKGRENTIQAGMTAALNKVSLLDQVRHRTIGQYDAHQYPAHDDSKRAVCLNC